MRFAVNSCLCEIEIITAPEDPYRVVILKVVISLIVESVNGLVDIGSPSFVKRVALLETFAEIRIGNIMLGMGWNDLFLKMFLCLFHKIRMQKMS